MFSLAKARIFFLCELEIHFDSICCAAVQVHAPLHLQFQIQNSMQCRAQQQTYTQKMQSERERNVEL